MTKIPRSELTATRRARLDRLATKLESLPADYKHFRMAVYVEPRGRVGHYNMSAKANTRILNYVQHNGGVDEIGCGTSACAVGHGPSAGIFVPEAHLRKYKTDSGRTAAHILWENYRMLFTGDGPNASVMFSWLFAGAWGRTDNSHYGAAARIRYLLDKMEIPDVFMCPRKKFVPLYESYRVRSPKALPVDFYTPAMLAQMYKGTAGVAKLELT